MQVAINGAARTKILTACFAVMLLAGCENTDRDTLKRGGTGAAVGAIAGGVIGSFSGNFGKGALAGAAIGGAGGYLYDQIKKDNN